MVFAPPDRRRRDVMGFRSFPVIHPPQFMLRALVLCDIIMGSDYVLHIPENPNPEELPISRARWLIRDHLRRIRRARDGPGFIIVSSSEDGPTNPCACLHPTYYAPRFTRHEGTDLWIRSFQQAPWMILHRVAFKGDSASCHNFQRMMQAGSALRDRAVHACHVRQQPSLVAHLVHLGVYGSIGGTNAGRDAGFCPIQS